MRPQLFGFIGLSSLLLCGSALIAKQSEPERFLGEGVIVAFHTKWRHPIKSYSSHGVGTPADLWIVRIDRWVTTGIEGKYFLVDYPVLKAAVNDDAINRKLRFHVRKPAEGDGSNPCAEMIRAVRSPGFKRTGQGTDDVIPPLKDLGCLVADEPPDVIGTEHHKLSGDKNADELRGEGIIVAFQKYNRYRQKP